MLKVNKNKITHIKLYPPTFGYEHFYMGGMYKFLPKKTFKFLGIPLSTYSEGFYYRGLYNCLGHMGQDGDIYRPDFSKEDVLNNHIISIGSKDKYYPHGDNKETLFGNTENLYIWTRPRLKVYIQDTHLKTLYFNTFERVQQFAEDKFLKCQIL